MSKAALNLETSAVPAYSGGWAVKEKEQSGKENTLRAAFSLRLGNALEVVA